MCHIPHILRHGQISRMTHCQGSRMTAGGAVAPVSWEEDCSSRAQQSAAAQPTVLLTLLLLCVFFSLGDVAFSFGLH